MEDQALKAAVLNMAPRGPKAEQFIHAVDRSFAGDTLDLGSEWTEIKSMGLPEATATVWYSALLAFQPRNQSKTDLPRTVKEYLVGAAPLKARVAGQKKAEMMRDKGFMDQVHMCMAGAPLTVMKTTLYFLLTGNRPGSSSAIKGVIEALSEAIRKSDMKLEHHMKHSRDPMTRATHAAEKASIETRTLAHFSPEAEKSELVERETRADAIRKMTIALGRPISDMKTLRNEHEAAMKAMGHRRSETAQLW